MAKVINATSQQIQTAFATSNEHKGFCRSSPDYERTRKTLDDLRHGESSQTHHLITAQACRARIEPIGYSALVRDSRSAIAFRDYGISAADIAENAARRHIDELQ
jgi:hypothetical protein